MTLRLSGNVLILNGAAVAVLLPPGQARRKALLRELGQVDGFAPIDSSAEQVRRAIEDEVEKATGGNIIHATKADE